LSILAIQTSSLTPVYLQIMDRIRSAVRQGALKPGATLPSVRQLASDLEINPNTVSKAYMLLEREGIIRTVRRRGSFVAECAGARIRESASERLDQTLDRLLEEAARLGLDRREILEALRRKIGAGESGDGAEGGHAG